VTASVCYTVLIPNVSTVELVFYVQQFDRSALFVNFISEVILAVILFIRS